MGLFGGEEKSLESLLDSVRAIEEAEGHLIALRDQIQQEMSTLEEMAGTKGFIVAGSGPSKRTQTQPTRHSRCLERRNRRTSDKELNR